MLKKLPDTRPGLPANGKPAAPAARGSSLPALSMMNPGALPAVDPQTADFIRSYGFHTSDAQVAQVAKRMAEGWYGADGWVGYNAAATRGDFAFARNGRMPSGPTLAGMTPVGMAPAAVEVSGPSLGLLFMVGGVAFLFAKAQKLI